MGTIPKHLAAGALVIAAVVTLTVTGHISGEAALGVIIAVAGGLGVYRRRAA